MEHDQPIYPKKLGILIFAVSAIFFIIKLGAFPIYVFAPIKTEPADIATRIGIETLPTVVANVAPVLPNAPAVVKKTT